MISAFWNLKNRFEGRIAGTEPIWTLIKKRLRLRMNKLWKLLVGGTGIEPCPFQEKCSTFKEFQTVQAQIHSPFIRRIIRTKDSLVNEEEWKNKKN